ncbi:uncharacterized protein LOC122093908 [Macadamia integrifolia]|uniref:uncharacterized protein LOC122093908 n=1 Tax=Macadamia integrifolia TaxID=60698 RepID=UPI001C4EC557|nr:uncharacterized protein LOC122093908 [Macadamia integrifolia]
MSLSTKDHLQELLIRSCNHDITFRNDEDNKPSTSNLFDVRNAITGIGPIRHSRFLEEKKWPPREMRCDQGIDRRIPATIKAWTATSSLQPLANQIHRPPMCVDDDILMMQPSRWSTNRLQTMQLQRSSLENQPKPVTPEVEENIASLMKNKIEEKEWLPNLQLSLSHSFKKDEKKKGHDSPREVNINLSLSLSSPSSSSREQAQSSEKQMDADQNKNFCSLQTNCSNKVTMRLST